MWRPRSKRRLHILTCRVRISRACSSLSQQRCPLPQLPPPAQHSSEHGVKRCTAARTPQPSCASALAYRCSSSALAGDSTDAPPLVSLQARQPVRAARVHTTAVRPLRAGWPRGRSARVARGPAPSSGCAATPHTRECQASPARLGARRGQWGCGPQSHWGQLSDFGPVGRSIKATSTSACTLAGGVGRSRKNRDRPRSYLGSTVELGHDLGCSGHAVTLYYNMAWAPWRVAIVAKSPYHPLSYRSAQSNLTTANVTVKPPAEPPLAHPHV